MKSTANVKITRDLKPPEAAGVHYRLLCMTGKNKGLSYYLKGKRAIMGRSDEVDVQVIDAKSSREHAELTLVNGAYVLTDLGSQNGVIVNDLKISQHVLEDGDKIIIGQTVFKFNILRVEDVLSLVENGDDNDEEDDEEGDDEENESSNLKRLPSPGSGKKEKKSKDGKKKKKSEGKAGNRKGLIYGVAILLVVLVLLPSEETKKQDNASSEPKELNTAVFAPGGATPQREEDREIEVKLNAVLHRGLREFREGNYFRAIEEFNFALLMSPNHGRATFYLNRTRQRLDEEIELNFFKARQETDALKYDAAIVSYCSIIRLLRDYKDDERYKESEKGIEDIKLRMGYDLNEDRCFTGQ